MTSSNWFWSEHSKLGFEAIGRSPRIGGLRESLRHFYTAVEQSPVAVALTDAEGHFLYVNQCFLDLTGYSRDDLAGHTFALTRDPAGSEPVCADMWRSLRAGATWRSKHRSYRKSGESYWESEVITPVRNDEGALIGYVVVREDITARKEREDELSLLATAFETGQATFITDADSRIIKANRAFREITGYPLEEVIGETPRIFKSGRHDQAFYDEMWRSLLETDHWQGEVWNRNKRGDIYPIYQALTVVRNDDGTPRNFISVFHNISDRKRAEYELEQQAVLDHLTGLLNRRAFDGAIAEHLRQANLGAEGFSFLLLDVDHFKAINDQHGHDAGDRVLQQLARLIRKCLRTPDVLSRWGGEEFGVLLPGTSLDRAEVIAERLRFNVAAEPLAGLEVTISVGLSHFEPGDSAESLLSRTDQALYRAKSGGRNRVVCCAGERYW